jgi:hypothetical protein
VKLISLILNANTELDRVIVRAAGAWIIKRVTPQKNADCVRSLFMPMLSPFGENRYTQSAFARTRFLLFPSL